MSFDAFVAIAKRGSTVTIHNVRLIEVQADESGHNLMTIEHNGATHRLVGGGLWREESSSHNVGKFGYIKSVQPFGQEPLAGTCYFYDYIDQSLRRVPELDRTVAVSGNGGCAPETVGWCCDARPNGFLAPVGIIPGESGRFVPDQTVVVELRVPPEFVRECSRVQMTPEEVLCSFVGDLSGIQNYTNCPRADGYGSNGSDERDFAAAWLERAHGMNAVDLNELEARAQEAEERQYQREDFAALLDDFENFGGQADDLFAAVQALVDKQASQKQ